MQCAQAGVFALYTGAFVPEERCESFRLEMLLILKSLPDGRFFSVYERLRFEAFGLGYDV